MGDQVQNKMELLMGLGKVCVVGLGYIGLPTATVIARAGFDVVGVDTNQQVVDTINAGSIHIVEADLDGLVAEVVGNGSLCAQTVPSPADIFVIAVPTPFKDRNVPDMRYVEAAVAAIAPVLQRTNLIILESTSPVGATEAIVEQLLALRPDLNFPKVGGASHDVAVAYCPERVLPGRILIELIENARVIGGVDAISAERARAFYKCFVEGECLVTTARTAEMCKLTENSFRDVNIAFANELSIICDRLDVNVWELIELANHHPRVNVLKPGVGVGGHCIAVDPWFLVHSAPDEARIIALARRLNDGKVDWSVSKVLDKLNSMPAPETGRHKITCLGLAFKPDIDDLRESPALQFCKALVATNRFDVCIVEPHIDKLPQDLAQGAKLVSLPDAFAGSDLVVALVKHDAFVRAIRAQPITAPTVDLCGLWAH